MAIHVICPSCGVRLNAPDGKAGRSTNCPKCGNPISIPAQIKPQNQGGEFSDFSLSSNSTNYLAHRSSPLSSFVQSTLLPGEQVIYRAFIHWAVFVVPFCFFAWMVVGFICIIFFREPFLRFSSGLAAIIFFIFGIGTFVGAFFRYVSSEFVVTDKRVIAKTGLLVCQSFEILLGKVEGIRVTQSIEGSLFGFGTIGISGTGTSYIDFKGIADPLACRRAIQQCTQRG